MIKVINEKFSYRIDVDDFFKIKDITWHETKGYMRSNKKGLMHRFIMNAQKGQMIDHIDGNRTNNCKSNLRFTNHKGNAANRKKYDWTIYKGVHFNKEKKKYNVSIGPRWMGSFDCPIIAARYYDFLAKKEWGEFAKLNFPDNPISEADIFFHKNRRVPLRENYNLKGFGKSHYRGVSQQPNGRWVGYVMFYRKQKHVGSFDDERSAAEAVKLGYENIFYYKFHGNGD